MKPYFFPITALMKRTFPQVELCRHKKLLKPFLLKNKMRFFLNIFSKELLPIQRLCDEALKYFKTVQLFSFLPWN